VPKTDIEWATHSLNPILGCSLVSEGCRNCYAMARAHLTEHNPAVHDVDYFLAGETEVTNGHPYAGLTTDARKWSGELHYIPNRVDEIARWTKPRPRVFVGSMSDVFHESAPLRWISEIMAAVRERPDSSFLFLTKRPERLLEWQAYMGGDFPHDHVWPPNAWIGVSVENQETADVRIPILSRVRARVKWLSMEPLLGPVDLAPFLLHTVALGPDRRALADSVPDIAWVVVGGESGPGARPMEPEWARDLRDQCVAQDTPFFFKQMTKKGTIPPDLLVREFPR
jgi:protein gp37